MWMMVMFDLPVIEAKERKAATQFRNFLEKQGFGMCQFSVYAKFCGTRDRTQSLYNTISDHIPEKGKVSIITFTDKQFGAIQHMYDRKSRKSPESPEQLLIFGSDCEDSDDA